MVVTGGQRNDSARGGRPLGNDKVAYGDRNVIEGYYAFAKQWRGIATRFDKLAITYRGGVTFCAILTWVGRFGRKRRRCQWCRWQSIGPLIRGSWVRAPPGPPLS
ncbi:hypothetical protein GCM10009820_37510 [Leifsonia soli]